MVEAVELIACHVFNTADRDHQRVSMEMVRTRLDRLAEHPRRRKRTSHAGHNPQISPNMSARLTDGTTSPRRRCLAPQHHGWRP
jgi:hypothetical protein